MAWCNKPNMKNNPTIVIMSWWCNLGNGDMENQPLNVFPVQGGAGLSILHPLTVWWPPPTSLPTWPASLVSLDSQRYMYVRMRPNQEYMMMSLDSSSYPGHMKWGESGLGMRLPCNWYVASFPGLQSQLTWWKAWFFYIMSTIISHLAGYWFLTQVVALETAGTGVTCNAVCPGWVLTPCELTLCEPRIVHVR